MEEMIAYCGLTCTKCPSYLATQADDDEARRKTAAFYAEKFGFQLRPEDINCDGCLSTGTRLIGYCQACDIRKCAQAKAVAHCIACDDQPCEKLKQFHQFSPDAKAAFEALIRRRDETEA
ncbi:MAG: DUF3795 domain-containing protein [Desulfosarcinaceae bacterium]|jgi:hypothetical protein